MDYEVQLRQSPPQWLAAGVGRANRSNLPKQVTTLGTPAWDYVKKNGIGNDGHHVALYYENGDGPCALPTPEGVVIAVGPRVHQPFENQPPVQCVELPAGTVAWTRHRGSYAKLGDAHCAVVRWCQERGHSFLGPYWEVYGHWTPNEAEQETDVFYALRNVAE